MKEDFFTKYTKILQTIRNEKKVIQESIEKIGLSIEESKISMNGKEVVLTLSSSQRMIFTIKGGEKILKEKGYKVLLR